MSFFASLTPSAELIGHDDIDDGGPAKEVSSLPSRASLQKAESREEAEGDGFLIWGHFKSDIKFAMALAASSSNFRCRRFKLGL